jgi:hypothetical protein
MRCFKGEVRDGKLNIQAAGGDSSEPMLQHDVKIDLKVRVMQMQEPV